MPCISGVAIDTLFSRVGSPLCHRYWLISHIRSHAAFRGTYLNRLQTFIEESDSTVGRQLHRRLAQDLAARVVKSTDNLASGHLRLVTIGNDCVYFRRGRYTCQLRGSLVGRRLPAVFGAKDIRQVVRQRDRPPGGPTRRTARSDSR